MLEFDESLYKSFVSTKHPGMFNTVISLGIDPELLKAIAVWILDNPRSSESELKSAQIFVDVYKNIIRESSERKPKFTDERAICVDNKGRRTDLKSR